MARININNTNTDTNVFKEQKQSYLINNDEAK